MGGGINWTHHTLASHPSHRPTWQGLESSPPTDCIDLWRQPAVSHNGAMSGRHSDIIKFTSFDCHIAQGSTCGFYVLPQWCGSVMALLTMYISAFAMGNFHQKRGFARSSCARRAMHTPGVFSKGSCAVRGISRQIVPYMVLGIADQRLLVVHGELHGDEGVISVSGLRQRPIVNLVRSAGA